MYDVDFVKLLKFEKRPFRARFSPKMVFCDLEEYKNDLASLTKYLKKFKISTLHFDDSDVTVGGEFDEDRRIMLHLFGDYENYVFLDEEWNMFKFRLIQTICHELIHWSQFDYRGHGECRVLKYVSGHDHAAYYSTLDEIEAYAHCMFLEMRREHPETPIIEVIENYGGETYDYIFSVVFKNNFDNLAVKRYVKEILRWEKVYKSL